jgi:hypothetical protein
MNLSTDNSYKVRNTYLRSPKREIKESTWLRLIVFSLVAILLLWPSYGEWKLSGVPNIAPPRLLKLILFIVLAYNFIGIGINFSRIKNRIKANRILFICLFLFNFIQFLTFSLDSQGGIWIYQFIKENLFGNILILFALLLVLRDADDVIIIFKILVITSLGITFFSIIELIKKENIFNTIVSNANISTIMAFTDKTRDFGYRVSSSFIHPLVLAHYATCLLPIAVFLLIRSTGFSFLIFFTAFFGLILDVILSSTRSGLAILIISLIVISLYLYSDWWRNEKNKIVKTLSLMMMPMLILIFFLIFENWFLSLINGRTHEETNSTLVRLGEIQSAIPKIFDSFFFGYGPTNATTGVGLNRYFGSIVDNYYLLITLQSGAIATFLLLACLFIPAKNLLNEFKKSSSFSMKPLAALAISFSIFMSFQAVHALNDLFILFYILLACFTVLNDSKFNSTKI